MRAKFVALTLFGIIAGCGATAHRIALPPEMAAAKGYRMDVSFASEVPEEYYVTSGPAQSYGKFRLNEQFREALERYAREKSDPAGRSSAAVAVRLLSVKTGYEEIGAPLGGRVGFVRRALEGNPAAPEELTKSAEATLTVEVEAGGKKLRKETFVGEAKEVIGRARFDSRSYDYQNVLDAAQRNAIEALDRIVDRSLGVSPGG